MQFSGRASGVHDRQSITDLMRRNLRLPADSPAIDPRFQDWKYWAPNPLSAGSRGYVLHSEDTIVSHGCRWPIRLETPSGVLDAFHMIDWVADPSVAGSGMKLLHDCARGFCAVFAVGGSAASQRVTKAFGFRDSNPAWGLRRPFSFRSGRDGSILSWQSAARMTRSAIQSVIPRAMLHRGWDYHPVRIDNIPEALFFAPTSDKAASQHAGLLEHLSTCPRFTSFRTYIVTNSGEPIAYFVLAQVECEIRLIDLGPPELGQEAAQMLGAAAQRAARSEFCGADTITTITTEPAVREGILRSGFREYFQKTVRVLPLAPDLRSISHFRLTMIDWDASCL